MMKRCLSMLLTLCMVFGMVPAMAESSTALNTYTSEGLEVTIILPDILKVTNEEDTEEAVVMTLAMDGRTDVGFSLSVSYNEAYADYTMVDIPDDLRQQMIDYYAQNYKSENVPTFLDPESDEPFEHYFAPFFASGTGADGNLYAIYICVCYGFVLTVSGGIAATEFDYDSFGALYNLYWQGASMFYDFLEDMGYIES